MRLKCRVAVIKADWDNPESESPCLLPTHFSTPAAAFAQPQPTDFPVPGLLPRA